MFGLYIRRKTGGIVPGFLKNPKVIEAFKLALTPVRKKKGGKIAKTKTKPKKATRR